MKNEVIELVVVIENPDADGFAEEARVCFEIMAEIKSVKRSEFYQAAHEGINVQLVAVINRDDLEAAFINEEGKKRKSTLVRYDDTDYKIVIS